MLFNEPPTSPRCARDENQKTAQNCNSLVNLRKEANSCWACEFSKDRKQVVFSNRAGRQDIMIIGEAPGKTEDQSGLPFTGAAGQLLIRALAGLGLKYEDVYIANILKCRPPENRDPAPEEIDKCTPFLDRQIELVDPKLIIAVGKFATQYLSKSTLPMGKLRGKEFMYGKYRVMPIWHTAYVLRQPEKADELWADLKAAVAPLGIIPLNEK